MIDIEQVRQATRNRWVDILHVLTAIPLELLDRKNHPCPKCGGKDRFRMIDEEAGALYCNQCFNKKNGDGIAAVMWMNGWNFQKTIAAIAREVGIETDYQQPEKEVDILAEVAWRKGITVSSMLEYGAEIADRFETTVCRFPMHDAEMNVIGHFDIANGDLEKGKSVKGERLGMFVTVKPMRGGSVCLVEGVKDACALHNLGIEAVGLPTSYLDANFARMFRGINVTIIPDRDKAGIEGASKTAAALFGVAELVKIAELPTPYKESGGDDVRDVLRSRDGEKKLRDAIANASVWNGEKKEEIVFITLSDALLNYVDHCNEIPRLYPLGLPYVDENFGGGTALGEMVVIAGRPSHGKSVAAMQSLNNLALSFPCLLITEEMTTMALIMRELERLTDLEPSDWIGPNNNCNRSLVRNDAANHYMERHPIYITEFCGTADRAVEAIEQAKKDFGIGAVCVDYIQSLQGKGKGRYEQITNVSKQLKAAAGKNNVIMLAVCQLNRQVEGRQTNRKNGGKDESAPTTPRLSDLRDSGQIEQDADQIIFVEWPWKTNAQVFKKDEYRISLAKNRNRMIKNSYIECNFNAAKHQLLPLGSIVPENNADQLDNYEPCFNGFN